MGQVVEYNVTNASLEELLEKYAVVPEINNKKDLEVVKGSLSELRTKRTGIEKERKALKSDALEWGRKVDTEAKRITEVLESIEAPLKAVKDAYDEEQEAIKQAKLQKEQERKEAITARINDIRKVPSLCDGMSPDDIKKSIDHLESLDIGDECFEEFTEEAAEATTEAINTLKALHVNAVLRVQKEADQERESERLAAEREEFEKEKAEEEGERDRIAGIKDKINCINNLVFNNHDRHSWEMDGDIESLENMTIATEDFAEFKHEAEQARLDSLDKLKKLKSHAKEKEDFEKQREDVRRTEELKSLAKERKAKEKKDEKLQAEKKGATINAIDEVLQTGNAADVVEAVIAGNIPNVRWEI